MRLFTSVVLTAAVLTAAPAGAADVAVPAWVAGVGAGPLVIYDYEPGVVVRAYWVNPWRNRRYFPSNGTAPKFGRRENQSQRLPVDHAKDFYREWSSFPLNEAIRVVPAPRNDLPMEPAPETVLPK